MPAQKEVECIAKLIEAEFPNTKSWVSFSCKVMLYFRRVYTLGSKDVVIDNLSRMPKLGS